MISGGVPDASLLTFADAERSPLSIRAKALVFFDPRSRRLRDEIEQLAVQPRPLLIVGETGTGKELLARHAHDCSEREGLFVPVSCSAMVESSYRRCVSGWAISCRWPNISFVFTLSAWG